MNLQIRTWLKAVRLDRNAIQIMTIYLLIGGLWIFFSDRWAQALSSDKYTLTMISTYKGWFYVLVTGLLLYWLIRRNNSRFQQENEELKFTEKNYRDIFDNATVGIYRSTPDGRLLTVNPELAAMFGYASTEEFLVSINDVAHQIYQDPARRQDFLRTLNEQGFIKEFINQERRKDGSVIWTSTTARVVKDDAGNVLYYEGFDMDITERKRSEESIKAILDTAIDGFYLVDMAGRILEVNDSYCSMIGYSREELLKMSIKDIEAAETEEVIKKRIQRIFESGSEHFETKHKRKDGRVIAIEASVNYLQGEQGKLFVFMRDITGRKKVEETLRENELRFRTFIEQAPLAINITQDTAITYANPAYLKMFGYSSLDQLQSVGPLELFTTEWRPMIMENIQRRTKGLAVPNYYEAECLRKDGTKIPILMYLASVKFSAEQATVGFILDITDRKLAEEKLRESEERFRSLYENSTIGLYRTTPDGKILLANPALVQMLGYSSFEELAQRNLEEDGYEAGYERSDFQTHIERDGEVQGLEASWKRKDGTSVFVRESAKVIVGADGKVLYYEGTVEDITERKQAEEVLRKSEAKFRAVVENSHDGINFADADGVILYRSPSYSRITGYADADRLGHTRFETVHADDLADVQRSWAEILRHPESLFTMEYRIQHKDGTWRWVETSTQNLLSNPNVAAIVLTTRDITERKQAEEALRQSEERFRTFVEQSADGVVIFDEQGMIAEWNRAQEELTGIPRVQSIGMPAWEMQFQLSVSEHRTESTHEHLKNSIQETLQTGRSAIYGKITSLEIQTASGERKAISQTAFPIKTEKGYRIGSIIRDLTEQQKSEKALFQSEGQLRALVTSLDDIVFEVDKQGTYLNIWTAEDRLLARPKTELLGQRIQAVLPRAIAQRIQEAIERSLDTGKVEELDYSLKLPTGQYWFLARISPILAADGSRKTVSMLIRDISKRKTAEENIRMRLAELETIHQSGLELGRNLEPEQIAQKIMDQMERNLNWHHSAVRLYDAESQTLKVIGFNVPGLRTQTEREGLEGHFNHLVQKPGDGLSGWAVQHNQTVRINDLRHDPRYTETFPGLNSGLYVPIKKENRILGVISVENESPEAFSESDEKLINTLANQAAIALENSRLQRETEQQLERLQALHSVDLAVTNSLDLNITLEVLINQVIQQLGADAVAIFLLQTDVNSLKYILGKGFHAHLLENASQNLSLNESLAGRAIFEHHIVQSQALQEPKGSLKEIWESEGFKCIYLIPLLTKGEPKGVMEVFYRSEAKTQAKGWMDFLETLAGQAAIAIENIQLFDGLQRSNMELAIAYDATIEGWSRAMDLRDEETEGHTRRVTNMTLKLAANFDFSGEMLMHIRRGALLHDIGKLGVPDNILLKPDKLTDEEWVVMKKHPTFAFEMIAPIQYLSRAISIPYCHHEKWDGTGYPRGLSGEQIPLEARIFAIVDVWDALTSDRAYRKAWTKKKAMEHIQSLAGTHFDPTVVERFLELQKKESGSDTSAQKVRKIVTSN